MSEELDTTFGDEAQKPDPAAAEMQGEPAQKPAEEQKKEEPKAAPSAEDFSFDLSDLQGPGVEVVKIGENVSRLPVERMKFSTSAKALISIILDNPVAVKVHYREGADGKGTSYLCLGAGQPCCEKDGLPRVRYVFPIVVYDVDNNFKLRTSELKHRALILGQEAYSAICNMAQLNGQLSKMDIAVQCSDERYQKCTYTYAGACRYRKSAKITKEVLEFWKANMKHLITPVAQKKDLNWVLNKPAPQDDAPTPVETAGQVNFSDVFSD